jgi:hypothetical protein
MYGTQICFIDYVQKLASPGDIFKRVSTAVMTIQDVLAPEGITQVVLSQVSNEKIKAGNADSDYSTGAKGGNDIEAASDCVLVTEYDNLKDPATLTVNLKHARRTRPGKRKYDINPSSGLILGESAIQGD